VTSNQIEVIGRPIPQGSKRAFVVRGTNRAVIVDQQGQALGLWREAIARAARTAQGGPTHRPVRVVIDFLFARPKGHTGKKGLLPSAPKHMTTKPDLDKLIRAVLDALTGVVWVDDSQVVTVTARKDYTTSTSVFEGAYIMWGIEE
jgi:Holliday junction resolvase RusA-like endonuclease